jgi:hypothetical protein
MVIALIGAISYFAPSMAFIGMLLAPGMILAYPVLLVVSALAPNVPMGHADPGMLLYLGLAIVIDILLFGLLAAYFWGRWSRSTSSG